MPRPVVHFVGFRGMEYVSAVRVWGQPHYVHLWLDRRAMRDIYPGDTVVFAQHAVMEVNPFNAPDLVDHQTAFDAR